MFGKLKGKKTYVTGFMAVIAAIASFLTGDASGMEAMQLGFTALLGMAVRNGIK